MKKIVALLLALCLCVGIFVGCSNTTPKVDNKPEMQTTVPVVETLSTPKYVFLFIGDGMSYPQIQSTADYLGAQHDENYFMVQPSLDKNSAPTQEAVKTQTFQAKALKGPEYLNFMKPSVLLDSAHNMHVLCQSSPDFYTYAVMDTHGKRSAVKLYKRTGDTVDLIGTGKGIFPIGVTPYTPPAPGMENVRKASDRPF